MADLLGALAIVSGVITLVTLAFRFNRLLLAYKRYIRSWRARRLRQVWGITDGDRIRVVCSELLGQQLQYPEDRQFIYLRKYGDVDALFEVVATLVVLYPTSEIRIMSAEEQAEGGRFGDHHLVLIGGPDYNALADSEIESGRARMRYGEADEHEVPLGAERVLIDTAGSKRYCAPRPTKYPDLDRDWGYFERYPASVDGGFSSRFNVILLGGPNTVGVTGIARAVAAFRFEGQEPSERVLRNAEKVAERMTGPWSFRSRRIRRLLLVADVRRDRATIEAPLLLDEHVIVE